MFQGRLIHRSQEARQPFASLGKALESVNSEAEQAKSPKTPRINCSITIEQKKSIPKSLFNPHLMYMLRMSANLGKEYNMMFQKPGVLVRFPGPSRRV